MTEELKKKAFEARCFEKGYMLWRDDELNTFTDPIVQTMWEWWESAWQAQSTLLDEAIEALRRVMPYLMTDKVSAQGQAYHKAQDFLSKLPKASEGV